MAPDLTPAPQLRTVPPAVRPAHGRVLGAAALIGAGPIGILLLLWLLDELADRPAAVALAASLVSALLLARLWTGNLAQLAESLNRAVAEDGRVHPPAATPLLPAVEEIGEIVGRLARTLAERGELVGRMRRADEAIVENLPDPLLVLSPVGEPLRANAAARAIFGGGPDNTGRRGDVAALLRHPTMASAVDRARTEGRTQTADLVLPVPIPREIAARVIPMDPPLADGGRLVVVLSDRTRERAVERMRADFVANASHELRTPLASLIGFIETLRGPAQDDPVATERFLGIMAEQSERMRRLIDDLLGLSRIELTEHTPPTGRVDLAELAQREADGMAPILARRQARLDLALGPALATPADAEQLAQVLRNLLENAVRHGRDGGLVRLGVAYRPGLTEGTTGATRLPARPGVLLSVADDGPGIPKEHLPRLTERFYRVDKGRSRNAGGTGLGLAIVKHIVNRHRGQLVIESEEGVGTTFRVWLPGGLGPPPEPAGAAPAGAKPAAD